MVFTLCEYLKQEEPGMEPVVIEIYRSGNPYAVQKRAQLKEMGVQLYTLGSTHKYSSLAAGPLALRQLLRKMKPAVVHAHTDLPDFVLAMTLRLLRRPGFRVFRTIHNTELWSTHSFLGKITESAFRNDTIVAVSQSAAAAYRQIRERYRLPVSADQHLVYNGIKEPAQQDQRFQLEPGKLHVAFAGRLERQKGIDILLNMLRDVPASWADRLHLHIIGSGHFEQEVRTFCAWHPWCTYHGAVSNLADAIGAFPVLLMPSRFEGMGLISAEASLAGTVVVASDVPGLNETLPTDWPLFVQDPSPAAWLAILDRLLQGKIDLEVLQKKAYYYVLKKFSWKEMGQQYAILYKE